MGERGKAKAGEAREFWGEAVRLWGESGLSVREFCGREGLGEHAFYSWRRELTAKSAAPEAKREAAVEFLPVRVVGEKVSPTTEAAPIEIVGASIWRVRIAAGFDATTLDAVLAALERRP